MRDQNGRIYHEQIAFQEIALQSLRDGLPLAEYQWKKLFPASRLPPVIEKLRNSHGFRIDGNGSAESPYVMPDPLQMPALVAVTPAMQEAYYETAWWQEMRLARLECDGYTCVLCRDAEELQVHHAFYRLFAEVVSDLMTVCRAHHEMVHKQARLKFPSGMTTEQANRLGVGWEHAEWLLPQRFVLTN